MDTKMRSSSRDQSQVLVLQGNVSNRCQTKSRCLFMASEVEHAQAPFGRHVKRCMRERTNAPESEKSKIATLCASLARQSDILKRNIPQRACLQL